MAAPAFVFVGSILSPCRIQFFGQLGLVGSGCSNSAAAAGNTNHPTPWIRLGPHVFGLPIWGSRFLGYVGVEQLNFNHIGALGLQVWGSGLKASWIAGWFLHVDRCLHRL